jgi:hypothetical protein
MPCLNRSAPSDQNGMSTFLKQVTRYVGHVNTHPVQSIVDSNSCETAVSNTAPVGVAPSESLDEQLASSSV